MKARGSKPCVVVDARVGMYYRWQSRLFLSFSPGIATSPPPCSQLRIALNVVTNTPARKMSTGQPRLIHITSSLLKGLRFIQPRLAGASATSYLNRPPGSRQGRLTRCSIVSNRPSGPIYWILPPGLSSGGSPNVPRRSFKSCKTLFLYRRRRRG